MIEEFIQKRINEWLSDKFDEKTRQEIRELVNRNDTEAEKELIDRFYKDLEFGTGGIRAIMGAGTNRLNVYTVAMITQGLANYIIQYGGQERGVVIGRDSRNNSDEFAKEVACILAANGIKIKYFRDIHPTPLVSFAIRRLNSQAGVMITASHNTKEYNGYKVFWEDGGQVIPPHDENIIAEVRKISSIDLVKRKNFEEIENDKDIFEYIDDKIDPIYLNKVLSLSIHPEVIRAVNVKICYTPLHGTGYKLVPEALRKFGFEDIYIVKEQANPDGDFPSAPSPNPEEQDAMRLGMKYAKAIGADILIATDPDADRVGIAVRQDFGEFLLLNGNQIATLLSYYIASQLKETDRMPKQPAFIKSVVTSGIITKIAKSFEIPTYEVLTGFKWIAQMMRQFEDQGITSIFGGEESHGYLTGTFVRDKDAIISSCLIAEMTAYYKFKKMTLAMLLRRIYEIYGYYRETQRSFVMKGREGAEQIQRVMAELRAYKGKKFGQYDLLFKEDLLTGIKYDVQNNKEVGKLPYERSNVIIYRTSRGKIIARPSGTEPKIKFYFSSFALMRPEDTFQDLQIRVDMRQEDVLNTVFQEFGHILGLDEHQFKHEMV